MAHDSVPCAAFSQGVTHSRDPRASAGASRVSQACTGRRGEGPDGQRGRAGRSFATDARTSRWRFSFSCPQLQVGHGCSIHPPAGSSTPAPLTDGHRRPMKVQHTRRAAKPARGHLGAGMASPAAPRAEQGQGQCRCPSPTARTVKELPGGLSPALLWRWSLFSAHLGLPCAPLL